LNSSFFNNTSEFGSCINLENIGGKVIVIGSLFQYNVVLPFSDTEPGPGSGAAIKLTGDIKTVVFLIKNTFLNNKQPNGGTIVNFGGVVFDYFSFYKGKLIIFD
jgi:hypothetical protein